MSNKYKMTMDLNVLEHLGINLYSNVAAVLSETVANAWDADAENVDITIDFKKKIIIIQDDGVGMTLDDMNSKYLRVGYRRRDSNETGKTPKGRVVMGRKGLGKLSLFSIADTIEIQSSKDGTSHGCRLSVPEIRTKIGSDESFYEPRALVKNEISVKKGTLITLRDLRRSRLDATHTALRKKIARRFSIIGEINNFNVSINGQKITIQDRDDISAVSFIWRIGNPNIGTDKKFEYESELASRSDDWQEDTWTLRGWIGTAATPKELDNKDSGNLNGITVLARGRLFHENILEKINDGRIYTKYVTGQIEADFLDSDNEEDIATSDRQRIKEDDPRYIALLAFLKVQLNTLEKEWSAQRGEREINRLTSTSAGIKSWLESLQGSTRRAAKQMLTKLGSLTIEREEDRKELFKHGILAFERLRIKDAYDELADNVTDVDKLLTLLGDRDGLEASLYRDIVKSRLDTISKFLGIVDEDCQEKVIQKYLFDHLWLLDPSWERITNTEVMEKRFASLGLKNDKRKELYRVDIAYRCVSNKHLIIELKRASRTLKGTDLCEQGSNYVEAMRKKLITDGEKNTCVDVVFVLGRPPTYGGDLSKLISSISTDSRVVYYNELICNAQKSYEEYFEASKKIDKLEQILKDI